MPIFLMVAGLGTLLLLISALFGGEHEGGGHDIGHVHEAEGAMGPNPFSIRIISVFLVAFGACGAIARYYNVSYILSSVIGVIGGAVVAFVALQLIKLFYAQQASSTITDNDLLNSLAEVKIEIPAGGLGQVSLVTKGQRIYHSARSKDGTKIEVGCAVKIIECPGDSLVVLKA